MSDQGTSVTLIFYKISGDGWWREPALNLIAAAAQFSTYTHVEISIGEAPGSGGQMANVVRIYNDAQGVVSKRPIILMSCSIHTSSLTLRFLSSIAGIVRENGSQPTGELRRWPNKQA